MAKLLRVKRSVDGALCVRHYYLKKKVVCGASPAEKAMMSLINDHIISKVGLYEALLTSRVYMRPQKLWLQPRDKGILFK